MTQLYDDSGKVTGYYLTVAEYERLKALEEENKRLQIAWEKATFTEEELQQAEAETEEYSTEEVLKYLETL
jgi:hypothetical protein